MSDLNGQDAFDRLLEVALDSRVSVVVAADARDRAQQAQREVERLAEQRFNKINELEGEKKRSLPKLAELWLAADQVRQQVAAGDQVGNHVVAHSECMERLRTALAEANDACDQIPF